jgi:DNA-directed RNA polymerase specialized sigma24 family protein
VKIISELAIMHDKFFREKAFLICKDKYDADDLVQEMYLKLYRYDDLKLKAIHEKGVLKFICIRILNQLFLDSKRKVKYEYSTNLVELYLNNKNFEEEKEKAEHIRNYFKTFIGLIQGCLMSTFQPIQPCENYQSRQVFLCVQFTMQ